LDNPTINKDNAVKLHAAAPGITAPGSTIQPDETAMTLPKGYVSRKAQFVPAFFQAIEDFEYAEKGPMSETTEEQQLAMASANHGQHSVDEIAQTVQEEIERSKMEGCQPKRRRSSLRNSFRANAMQTIIFEEKQVDDELVVKNQEKIRENSGNLYTESGRVLRAYS